MSFAVTADVERFDEALDWFLDRKVVTKEELNRILVGSSQQAFWVGGALQADQIQRVFDEIGEALRHGEPFDEWRKRVMQDLPNDAHAETVFRNAAQRAYNSGRYQQMRDPDVLRFRPFWMYDAILDSATTPICRALGSPPTVMPADDPGWHNRIPPLHHRCRSGIRSLRRSEAERRGIANEWPEGGKPDGDWGDVPTMAPDDGWRPKKGRYDPAIGGEFDRKSRRDLPAKPPKRKRKAPKRNLEPVPSERPKAKLDQETAKRILPSVTGLAANGREFRDWVRQGLRDHAEIGGHRPNNMMAVNPRGMPSRALGVTSPVEGTRHYSVVGLSSKAHKELRQDLKEVAKTGKPPRRTNNPGRGVQVVVHEEVHLAARSRNDTLFDNQNNHNRFVEEVTTELASQRIAYQMGAFDKPLRYGLDEKTKQIFPNATPGLNRRTAYLVEVEIMVSDVRAVTGWSQNEALERITDAAIAMRKDSVPLYQNEHVEDFVQALDLPEQQRVTLDSRLRSRRLTGL